MSDLNPNNRRKKNLSGVYKAEMGSIDILKNMNVPVVFVCILLHFGFVCVFFSVFLSFCGYDTEQQKQHFGS